VSKDVVLQLLAIGIGIQAVLIDRMNVVAVLALEKADFRALSEATNVRFKFEVPAAARTRAWTYAGRLHRVLHSLVE
jgi:L-arabinose isomerase